ncbi:MAG: hypothetical protein V4591_01575 [Bdellovibrionota bacterium]
MFIFFKKRKNKNFKLVNTSKSPKEKFLKFKKSCIEIDPVKILRNLFSKKVILPLIILFVLAKGYKTYVYTDFYNKGEEVVLNISYLRDLCLQNAKFDRENRNDFLSQQKLVYFSMKKFVSSYSYSTIFLFLEEDYLDDKYNLYINMIKKSHENCSEILKNNPKTLQEQLNKIVGKPYAL